MAFFALGIEQMMILNNRELFGRGEAKFWSFASDENWRFPNFDRFKDATHDERRAFIRNGITDITQSWCSPTYHYFADNQRIIFGDTGCIVFKRDYIPEYFHWTMFAIERDDDIRNIGEALDGFFTDERVDEIASSVLTIAGSATSPVTAASLVLAKASMEGITLLMRNNKDDQLMVIEQSFIRRLHYPRGTRHSVDIASVMGNVYYDYFIYGYHN